MWVGNLVDQGVLGFGGPAGDVDENDGDVDENDGDVDENDGPPESMNIGVGAPRSDR
jgi:hypothetical protein